MDWLRRIPAAEMGLPCVLLLAALLGGAGQEGFALHTVIAVVAILVAAEHFKDREHRKLDPLQWKAAALLASIAIVMFLQIVPLPPDIWTLLPGREYYAEGYSAAGMSLPWLPISLAPERTLQAATMALVPLLTFSIALTTTRRAILISFAILVLTAAAGVLLGFYQQSSGLYLYDITNLGSGVGLFANANQAAVFYVAALCGATTIAIEIADNRSAPKPIILICVLALVVAVVLAGVISTNSRAGLGLFVLVAPLLALTLLLPVRSNARKRQFWGILVGGGVLGCTLTWAVATNMFDLTLATAREVDRPIIWARTLDLAWSFFPVGAGADTFVDVYPRMENPNAVTFLFVNAAHNDYLEWLFEFGILAPVFFVGAVVILIRGALRRIAAAPDLASAVIAATMALLTVMLHSVVEYPLGVLAMTVPMTLFAAYLLRLPEGQPRKRR